MNFPPKVPSYGGPSLDDDELAAMALAPKFSTHPKIVRERIEVECEITLVKLKWDLTNRDLEEEKLFEEDVKFNDHDSQEEVARKKNCVLR